MCARVPRHMPTNQSKITQLSGWRDQPTAKQNARAIVLFVRMMPLSRVETMSLARPSKAGIAMPWPLFKFEKLPLKGGRTDPRWFTTPNVHFWSRILVNLRHVCTIELALVCGMPSRSSWSLHTLLLGEPSICNFQTVNSEMNSSWIRSFCALVAPARRKPPCTLNRSTSTGFLLGLTMMVVWG